MEKGKAPRELNVRQKSTSRRASMASLSGKNDMSQQKAAQVERSPSVQNSIGIEGQVPQEAVKSALISKAVETCIPKTRFKSQDSKELRSNPSPRIKSFPAEKIRRMENPAQSPRDPAAAMIPGHNPHSPGNFYVPSTAAIAPAHGQGDTTHIQYQQNMNRPMQNQAYPQQVNCQLPQLRQNSDGMLAQTNTPQNYQVHRPFVPNTNHGMVHKNVSHGEQHQQQQQQPEQQQPQQQQQDNQDINSDLKTQPVGGRNAAMYRQTFVNNLQAENHCSMSADQLGLSPMTKHHSVPNTHNHSQIQQPCQQPIYQQSERKLVLQKEVQQEPSSQQAVTPQAQQQFQPYTQPDQQAYFGYYNQKQMDGKNYGQAGMTSPQDVIINQIKNSRNLMYSYAQLAANGQTPSGYIIPPQNGWVHPNEMRQDYPIGQKQQQGMQPVGMENNKLVQEPLKNYQQHNGAMGAVQKPMVRNEGGQLMGQRSPAADPEGQGNEDYNKKTLKFTADMIRDQEMLVNNMRQQGVPDEIMRRQFDILLREQRKQLTYMVGMKEVADDLEVKRAEVQPRKRRQSDEKPEWMAHITPPRHKYCEKDRSRGGGEGGGNEPQSTRKHEVEGQKEIQRRMDEGKPGQMESQLVQYQQMHPQNQANPSYTYWQQYPAGYQQQAATAAYPLNTTLHPPAAQYPYQNTMPQQSNTNQLQDHYKDAHVHNYQSVHGNPYWPESQVPQQQTYTLPAIQNQQANQLVEEKSNSNDKEKLSNGPFSLLKMKVYKDVIRPRKRNNGLQDSEALQQMAEALKSPEGMKGLEYLANMDKKLGSAKLNGVQESGAAHADLIQRPPEETTLQRQKRISANGLENTRNLSNPPAQQRLATLKTSQSETFREFPRQKHYNPREHYTIQAERDTGVKQGQLHSQNYQQPHFSQQQFQGYQPNLTSVSYNNMHVYPFNSCAQQQQQQQQHQQPYNIGRTYQPRQGEGDIPEIERSKGSGNVSFNRAAGDATRYASGQEGAQVMPQNKMPAQQFANPLYQTSYHCHPQEIHEPKTIGGIKYLARKPMFIPTQRMSMPEASIPNMQMQVLANA